MTRLKQIKLKEEVEKAKFEFSPLVKVFNKALE